VNRGRLAAWFVLAVGFTYLIFIGGGPGGIQIPQLRLLSVVGSAIALGSWAFVAIRDPHWRPRSALLPAFALCLGSMAISTITSRSPRISVEFLAYAVLWVGLYLLLVQLLSRGEFRDRILGLASLCGIAIATLLIAVIVTKWLHFWSDLGHLATPPFRPGSESLMYGNPSMVLALVVLLGAVAVGWLTRFGRRGHRLAIAALAVFGATALMTGTRGGWIAVGIGAAASTAVVVYASGTRRSRQVMVDWVPRRSRLFLAAAGVALIPLALVLVPAAIQRLSASVGNRVEFFRIAIEQFLESPVLGIGPGMWAAQQLFYTVASDAGEIATHAHDIYLQSLAELGILGIVAGVVAALILLRLVVDGLRDQSSTRRRWAVIAIFTSAYFGAHQLVDFFANKPAVFAAFVIPIALLDATRPQQLWPLSNRLTELRSGLALGGASVVAVTAIVVGALVEVPALIHAAAVEKANAGDWSDGRRLANEAVAMDPGMPIYRLTAGLAAAHAGDHVSAADNFRIVVEATDLPEAWLDLAAAQASLGNSHEALDALRSGLRIGIRQPAIAVAAAQLALELGDRRLATDALANAFAAVPFLASDPGWAADPARDGLRAAAVSRVVDTAGPALTWQIAMYTGDYDAAYGAADELPADAGDSAVQVISAMAGNPSAYGQLAHRCYANPYDPVLRWCAAVAERLGNPEAARFRGLAEAVGASGLEGELVLVVDGADVIGTRAPAMLFGVAAFRHATPWDSLSPTLLHVREVEKPR
jgi:O-antigen ligase